MLIEYDMFGERHDKVKDAVDMLRFLEPEEGYYLAFSGGKDSQAVFHLSVLAGVKFDAHMRITGTEPHEVIRFVKDYYPTVKREHAHDKDGNALTMWNLIPKKLMPPTRIARYCCSELKETGGKGRLTITGVRKAESVQRATRSEAIIIKGRKLEAVANRENANYKSTKQGGLIMAFDNDVSKRVVEQCYRTNQTTINPIINWTEDDVWQFLNDVVKVPHCSLYDEGYKRIGCVGCPMASNQKEELERWPKYRENYVRAFDRMLKERERKGLETLWKTGEEVMKWWIGEAAKQADQNQISMDEIIEAATATEAIE